MILDPKDLKLEELLKDVRRAALAGHIRPDGDAVGACLGLALYLKNCLPDLQIDIFLSDVPSKFHFLKGMEMVLPEEASPDPYDVFIALDSSDEKRLGRAREWLDSAAKTICIDHHISNLAFADLNVIVPNASSTCEVLTDCMKDEWITRDAAAALYLGIVHDSGVFRHSSTSPETLEAAARLMRKDIPFSSIISDTYYDKTYLQNQVLGRALMESILLMDGRVIVTSIRKKTMEFYGVNSSDLDGIVQVLMGTAGVEVAIFLYEIKSQEYKVSLRSRNLVDVRTVATYFGGGGHIRAAGFEMNGSIYDVINNITARIEMQLGSES